MNVNQILNMAMRIIVRKFLNRGIDAGIDLASRRGKPKEHMTQQDKNQASAGKEVANRARQMARLGRKIGRF